MDVGEEEEEEKSPKWQWGCGAVPAAASELYRGHPKRELSLLSIRILWKIKYSRRGTCDFVCS